MKSKAITVKGVRYEAQTFKISKAIKVSRDNLPKSGRVYSSPWLCASVAMDISDVRYVEINSVKFRRVK